ncbi:MAG: arylsulfotransferase family protein [Bdellovibrionota bacterium]
MPTISNADHRWRNSSFVVIKSFDRRKPPLVSFPNPKKVFTCRFDGKTCPKDLKFTLLPHDGLPRLRTFFIHWRDEAGPHELGIRFLTRLGEGLSAKGQSNSDKHIFFANNGSIGAIDPKGELVFIREFDIGVVDFRPQIVKGKTFYTYGLIRDFNTNVNSMASHVVLDETMQIVETHHRIVDSHEFLFLGRKHYLFTNYEAAKRDGDGKCLLKQYLIEEKDGKDVYVVSTDDLISAEALPDYGSTVAFNGKNCIQNGHLNGVEVIDANRWLISFGDGPIIMWLKKERRAEWVLGGEKDQFGLRPDQRTALHHTPRWSESEKSILVFDNGNVEKRSRLIKYVLDLKQKSLREFKTIDFGDGFAWAGGNVETDGKTISIGTGFWDKPNDDFVELVDGKKTMSIRLCISCVAGRNYRVYRGPFR